jgi:hypothetical protein
MLRGNASNAKHALPDDGKRAEKEQRKCDVGSSAIPSGSPSGIRLGVPSRIARRKSSKASAPSTTQPIDLFTAQAAVTPRRQNAILPRTESMKTAIERKPRNKERRF